MIEIHDYSLLPSKEMKTKMKQYVHSKNKQMKIDLR